jgi:hypothetical protein
MAFSPCPKAPGNRPATSRLTPSQSQSSTEKDGSRTKVSCGKFGRPIVLTRFGKRLVAWTGSANQTALLRGNPGNLANFPEGDFRGVMGRISTSRDAICPNGASGVRTCRRQWRNHFYGLPTNPELPRSTRPRACPFAWIWADRSHLGAIGHVSSPIQRVGTWSKPELLKPTSFVINRNLKHYTISANNW